MKTDDLIGLLARQAGPASAPHEGRRLALGLALAVPVMVAAVAALEGLLPMALWPQSSTLPKLAYAILMALTGFWLLRRIGRPGSDTLRPMLALGLLLALSAGLGMVDAMGVPAAARMAQVMGHSALQCPFLILGLSVPALAAALLAARRLAPTNLPRAGLGAGLLAGGVAAAAYALACTEGAIAFIAVWYTIGILLAGALGAVVGSRFLRW